MSKQPALAKPAVPRLMPAAPLSRAVWGIPGPAWTLAAWAALASVLLFTAIFLPLTDSTEFPLHTLAAAFLFAAIAIIPVVLRSRTPHWFIHASVIAWIITTCVLVVNAQAIEISLLFDGFLILAVYVGYWMPLSQVRLYALGWTAASALSLVYMGAFTELAMVWVADVSISVALAFFVNVLTRYLGQQAIHDPLTGLLNRAGLDIALTPIHARSEQLEPVAVMMIDLDGFKQINDKQGHHAGDEILVDVARRITSGLRTHDIAARAGGDEFILVLPNTTTDQAQEVAQRLGDGFPCEWSYGIAEWSADESFDEATRRADDAMYEQKHGKPGRSAHS